MKHKQEFIDEEPTEEPKPKVKKIGIVEMLQHELRTHMETALEYKNKINEAKTSYKKKYFGKKLKKNNLQAMKILTAIERMSKIKDEQTKK